MCLGLIMFFFPPADIQLEINKNCIANVQSFFCLKQPAKTEMKGDLVVGVLNYSLIKESQLGW